MTNSAVDGVTNTVAGGAVRATVKNATAVNGIASVRWNTNAISYPPHSCSGLPGTLTLSAARAVRPLTDATSPFHTL
jgi:hypothetical protein